MKRIISTTFALFVALAMSIGLMGSAQAAPPEQAGPPADYTSSTVAPLLSVGDGLLYQLEGFGGTTYDSATQTITAEVIGNPDASGIVIQKGGIVLTKLIGANAGETLTIENIMYKMDTGEVTAVLNGERVLLYTAVQTSSTISELYVAEEGGLILQEFINFIGLPAIGSLFGTSTLSVV